MSLHFIGIRDFPVLHRQLTSPKSPSFKTSESPTSTRDLARDSKDVLIQRLNDLALRLVTEENLEDEDITALHVEVDRMERVIPKSTGTKLNGSFHEARSRPSTRPSTAVSRDQEEDVFWGPFSPSRKVAMRFPDSPARMSRQSHELWGLEELNVSSQKASLLTEVAEALREQLSNAVKELQARREESNHVHDLLVTRAETAAQRIITLESHIQDLDADFEANQSELSFLRLQLRALEVQGMQYVPFNADEELSQSIKNWKIDWADIDQRTRTRRKKYGNVLQGGAKVRPLDDSGSVFDG